MIETERSLTQMGLSPHEKAFGMKLTALGARVIVYYLYNARATVCLLIKEGKVVARGLSICNPKDQFIKRLGQVKAIGYAIKAYTRATNSLPVPHGWERWKYMSSYLPLLLPDEKVIMDRFGKEKLND